MPLDALDPVFDRQFEDLYAELRARIPMYNPQWTNFNDSDPGITLLQLFAFLGETLLHQMGQVPRKNYIKFAQLLGLEVTPPEQAVVHLTFTPKATERPATIKARSIYSASIEDGPVRFETLNDLDVIGAPLDKMFVHADGRVIPLTDQMDPAHQPFRPLGINPQVGNALYLAFRPNPANTTPFPQKLTFLALRPSADTAGAPTKAGTQDSDLEAAVSLMWEYRPRKDRDVWEPLNLFKDDSAAFTRDGYIEVEGPQTVETSRALGSATDQDMYWLRVRLDQKSYPAGRAPRLEYLLPNTVEAENLSTELDDPLGASSGSAGQTFKLPRQPVAKDSLQLVVMHGSVEQAWTRVDDLQSSKLDSQNYTLNAASGVITFGDGAHGLIPTAGDAIIARKFLWGGGARGNKVAAGAVTGMTTQVAGIDKVTNVRAAAGGADEQSLEDFQRSAPSMLSRRGRVVTADDFAKETLSIGGVKQAVALPARHPDYPGITVPGAVTVIVVPDSTDQPPQPSAELLARICRALDKVRLLTTEVYVAAPGFVEIRVEARLIADPTAPFGTLAQNARQELIDALSAQNRTIGGTLSTAEIYKVLFESDDQNRIRSIDNLLIYVDGRLHEGGGPITLDDDQAIYSGNHMIVVQPLARSAP
jgi:predicted phage baseplate assembly protein